MLKKRLEALEALRPGNATAILRDVPLHVLLEVACAGGDVEGRPSREDILRGLFSGPPAQTSFLPLALRLLRRGLDARAARFIADAVGGKATEAEARDLEREIGTAH